MTAARRHESSIDEELLKAAQQGDQPALNTLLASIQPMLWIVAKQGLDPQLAARVNPSDAVQSTLRQVTAKLSERAFENVAQLRQWLLLALEHKLIDLGRRHMRDCRDVRRDRGHLDSDANPCTRLPAPEHHAPEELLSRREHADLVRQAIGQLSSRHREVIEAYWLDELPLAEIAARLDLTTDQVWGRLTRGLGALRQVLKRGEVG
ncbi:MAG: sigma-70 family RNA polymerase sigma factor [Planctomycetia bacterium]|nr:sigma-70 family RNA polymerase sigma factor [Planctomycetia bacterium]